jgi:ABC-type branched-subunit amino acid transport system substrate-binding protein
MRRLLATAFIALAALVAVPAQAQEPGTVLFDADPVPRIAEAELIFEQALEAFRVADYAMAYRRFRLVTDRQPLNRKTTAAWLMAGKSLYRQGEYAQARDLLRRFAREYPTSGYVSAAERTTRLAENALAAPEVTVADLGVLLPLGGQAGPFAQAFFNGVRLAVNESNDRRDAFQVRMVFEESDPQDADQTRRAVTSLAVEGVDAVLGPLFSEEARVAAEAAERATLTLVAPLATEGGIAEGRRYAFQANPTYAVRGEQMARFATRNLRQSRFGIVADRSPDGISASMADGFERSAQDAGAEVPLYVMLPDARAWYDLENYLSADTLAGLDALFMPLSANGAARRIDAALSTLQRFGITARPLGNTAWDRLPGPVAADASRMRTVYTSDFHVEPEDAAVRQFLDRYAELTGSPLRDPDEERLAITGYDVARYLIAQMRRDPARPLHSALRDAPPADGLGTRLHFDGEQINQALFFLTYRDSQPAVMR